MEYMANLGEIIVEVSQQYYRLGQTIKNTSIC